MMSKYQLMSKALDTLKAFFYLLAMVEGYKALKEGKEAPERDT